MSPGVKRFGNPSNVVNRMKPYDKNMSPAKMNLKDRLKAESSLGEDSTLALADTGSSDDFHIPVLKIKDLCLPPFRSPVKANEVSSVFERDQPGFPTLKDWTSIMEDYLAGLHPRKRDKALISQEMHELIYDVLANPDETRHGTPQFRFWARKMFSLVEIDGAMAVVHEGRAVAVKEHIYDILCMCHAESGHAGRDKTCKVIREYYTWVPKELTASFVKNCPTCVLRRSGNSVFVSNTFQAAPQQHIYEKENTDSTPEYLTGTILDGSPNDPQYQREPRRSTTKSGLSSLISFNDSENSLVNVDTQSHEDDKYELNGIRSSDSSDTDSQDIYSQHGSITGKDKELPPLMQWLSDVMGPDSFGPNNTLPSLNRGSLTDTTWHSGDSAVSLPPLMNWLYVTQDRDTYGVGATVNPANTQSNASETIPIDPILLFEGRKSSLQSSKSNNDSHRVQEDFSTRKLTGMLREVVPTALKSPGHNPFAYLWDQQSNSKYSEACSSSFSTPSVALSHTNSTGSYFVDSNFDTYEEDMPNDSLSFTDNDFTMYDI